jgi:hypothetical protein
LHQSDSTGKAHAASSREILGHPHLPDAYSGQVQRPAPGPAQGSRARPGPAAPARPPAWATEHAASRSSDETQDGARGAVCAAGRGAGHGARPTQPRKGTGPGCWIGQQQRGGLSRQDHPPERVRDGSEQLLHCRVQGWFVSRMAICRGPQVRTQTACS